MWIKCTNPATEKLFIPEVMDDPIEFSGTGTAQVPEGIGEQLIDRHDAIERHESDNNE